MDILASIKLRQIDSEGMKNLIENANNGNPEAQFQLGYCYRQGYGVRRNHKSATKWWRLAAAQKNVDAIGSLAMCYFSGRGVDEDKAEALRLWKLAAEQGDVQALSAMARCYSRGDGVAQDKEEAFKLWTLAAQQGDTKARNYVGACYYNGDGVEQNYEEAVKWFSMGIHWENGIYEGDFSSAKWMGECYLHGHGVEKNIAKTLELWENLQGSYSMYMRLAQLYSDGVYMEPNYKKAAKWLYEAGTDDNGDPTRGVPEAMYELACYYYEGKGVEKDHQKALERFQWAIRSYERFGGGKAYAEKAYQTQPELIPQQTQNYFNAYKMAAKLGGKAAIKKLRTLAKNGEEQAKAILNELGMEL